MYTTTLKCVLYSLVCKKHCSTGTCIGLLIEHLGFIYKLLERNGFKQINSIFNYKLCLYIQFKITLNHTYLIPFAASSSVLVKMSL